MKQSLAVDLGGLRLANPVLAASGCLGVGADVPASLVDVHRLGAVVTRSLTYAGSKGWPTPRAAETSSGVLSAVGTQNPGVQAFLAHDLPRLRKGGVPLIASVAGSSLNEYVNVAGALHLQEGIVGLEVYLSCPDDEREGEPFYGRIERLTEIVGAVARLSRVPVFAKLPAFVPGIVETAPAPSVTVSVRAPPVSLISSFFASNVRSSVVTAIRPRSWSADARRSPVSVSVSFMAFRL